MGMENRLNFTKKTLSGITAPKDGKRLYYYDTKLPGLALSITPAGTMSFLIYKKIKGKPVRYTLGRFPAMTTEQARREGQKVLGQISAGVNPVLHKKSLKTKGVVLQEVFADFLEARKNLKETTIRDYQRLMREAFSDWQKKPILILPKIWWHTVIESWVREVMPGRIWQCAF